MITSNKGKPRETWGHKATGPRFLRDEHPATKDPKTAELPKGWAAGNDLGNIETHITGLWAMVVVPGYGSIFMDVGHIAWDPLGNVIFDAGKHQWWDANVDELCDYLANGD